MSNLQGINWKRTLTREGYLFLAVVVLVFVVGVIIWQVLAPGAKNELQKATTAVSFLFFEEPEAAAKAERRASSILDDRYFLGRSVRWVLPIYGVFLLIRLTWWFKRTRRESA